MIKSEPTTPLPLPLRMFRKGVNDPKPAGIHGRNDTLVVEAFWGHRGKHMEALVHVANMYPKLIAGLKAARIGQPSSRALSNQGFPDSQYLAEHNTAIDALLAECGETP